MVNVKTKLLELSKYVSKYCVGMEGNTSTKIQTIDSTFLSIKASGTKLSTLTENDLVDFDFNGKQLSNLEKKGSMELGFHTYLLGFEGINFVSHTHPTNTLKILCGKHSRLFAEHRLFPDQVVFNGSSSCLVPYAKPGNELTFLIKECVESFIMKEGYFPKIILLENHGVITCGRTIDECIISTEICEKSAEIFIQNTNKSKFLSNEDVKNLIEDDKEKYRQKQLI